MAKKILQILSMMVGFFIAWFVSSYAIGLIVKAVGMGDYSLATAAIICFIVFCIGFVILEVKMLWVIERMGNNGKDS